MALIQCLECGKEISENAASCPNCGNPNIIREKPVAVEKTGFDWAKLRKRFGIADLSFGLLLFAMIITSEGGIENNIKTMGTSWFLIWCGLLGIFGNKKRWATISSIVFYSIGILYNIILSFFYPAYFLIAAVMIVFLVFVSISLKDKS